MAIVYFFFYQHAFYRWSEGITFHVAYRHGGITLILRNYTLTYLCHHLKLHFYASSKPALLLVLLVMRGCPKEHLLTTKMWFFRIFIRKRCSNTRNFNFKAKRLIQIKTIAYTICNHSTVYLNKNYRRLYNFYYKVKLLKPQYKIHTVGLLFFFFYKIKLRLQFSHIILSM